MYIRTYNNQQWTRFRSSPNLGQMLSVVMFEDMNRSEQESLYRTSRTLSLVPAAPRVRHHSHGNIRQDSSVKIFSERNSSYSEDLVLSVLKSPLNHIEDPKDIQCRPSPGSEDELVENTNEDNGKFKGNSEDELTEDATERIPFLQRLRGHRTPRFGEAHHKRVPTPLKRKQKQQRKRSHDVITNDDVVDEEVGEEPADETPRGVPDPYYPIYLPIDQAFKAKYVFHHKKGKTFQERLYVFLEHPGGWICFVYHFTV